MEKVICNCKKERRLDTLELTTDFSIKNNAETTLQLRRNSKAISSAINGKLCYIDSAIHKDYQAAYFCNEYIFQDGNKITSKYLDTKFPTWKFFNVYDSKTQQQIANFTINQRPTKRRVSM